MLENMLAKMNFINMVIYDTTLHAIIKVGLGHGVSQYKDIVLPLKEFPL